MNTSIADFNTSLYISAIKNIALHLPHICILGTDYYENTLPEAFKFRKANQGVL